MRFDPCLRPGLAFLAVHFHDRVATNDLTIDAVDPKSGTSEFKATAIRVEKGALEGTKWTFISRPLNPQRKKRRP